jgi:predicted HicB family RNase H-like nuclease
MPDRTPPQITTDTPIGEDVDLDREDVRLPDGSRLTDEAAEDIVEQVRRSAGRPSLSGNKTSSPQIAFRVPLNVRDQAERIAADENKTVSQLAREALEERLRAS